jgi:hypothetical protein
MTLWTFTQSVLLVLNAFAILNERRFLEKVGLGQSGIHSGYVSSTSPRGQLIGLITATSYMRSASSRRRVRPSFAARAAPPRPRLVVVVVVVVVVSDLPPAPRPPPTPVAVPLVVLNSLVIFVKVVFG